MTAMENTFIEKGSVIKFAILGLIKFLNVFYLPDGWPGLEGLNKFWTRNVCINHSRVTTRPDRCTFYHIFIRNEIENFLAGPSWLFSLVQFKYSFNRSIVFLKRISFSGLGIYVTIPLSNPLSALIRLLYFGKLRQSTG